MWRILDVFIHVLGKVHPDVSTKQNDEMLSRSIEQRTCHRTSGT